MAEPRARVSPLRIALATVVALVFLVSCAGLWISGPVVVRVPAVEVDATPSTARLRTDVERLCGPLSPRDAAHTENLDRAASWIYSEFHEAGLPVEVQRYRIGDRTYQNVIASVEGSDADRGALIVGAHYDAYRELPGADDNASGVAVLLELARTRPRERPRRTWMFVAFSTEEPPHFGSERMGSAHFVRRLVERGTAVDLMVALDGVGRFSDEPGSQRFPLPGVGLLYPSRGDFIAVVGDMGSGAELRRVKTAVLATRSIPIHSFRAPRTVDGVDWSDHLPFRDAGFPAVLVTDTLFARHDDYHAPTDTPDRLDYERMAQVVIGLHGLLLPDVADP